MSDNAAIFGGSFNPIHMGHINMARAVMRELDAAKVVFLPNANPPHKDAKDIISANHRYNMVALAIEGEEGFELSDYEMQGDKPSYTVNTMRYMRELYKSEPYFIIGADSLYTLHTWRSFDELIRECSFVVADRDCSEGSDVRAAADRINAMGGRVRLMSMPRYNISSTQIREGIARGDDMSAYLPPSVDAYIRENNLYR